MSLHRLSSHLVEHVSFLVAHPLGRCVINIKGRPLGKCSDENLSDNLGSPNLQGRPQDLEPQLVEVSFFFIFFFLRPNELLC